MARRCGSIRLLLWAALGLALALPAPTASAAAAETGSAGVLIVYDSLGEGTFRQGSVQALERMLASYGMSVTAIAVDDYAAGTLGRYAKAIGVGNRADLDVTNPAYLRDLEAYGGDYLHIGEHVPERVKNELKLQEGRTGTQSVRLSIGPYAQTMAVSGIPYIERSSGTAYGSLSLNDGDTRAPYGVGDGRVAYVPYLEKGNLSELALGYVLKDWLPTTGQARTYLLFKEIYPFSDLDLLTTLADRLYEAGIPFLVSVRPVFDNLDYPAMQRYLKALRHVQSKNGSVLVNAPAVSAAAGLSKVSLADKMATFVDVLERNDIVPLGIGADWYWAFDRTYAAQGMGGFDSAVLFDADETPYRDRSDVSAPFASALYSVPADGYFAYDRADSGEMGLPMNAALTFDFPGDRDGLERIVSEVEGSWIPFADYKYAEHTVRTEAHELTSRGGLLYADGRSIALNGAMQETSGDYTYVPEQTQRLKKLFDAENKFLIATVLTSLFLFGLLLAVGIRQYRRKFYNR